MFKLRGISDEGRDYIMHAITELEEGQTAMQAGRFSCTSIPVLNCIRPVYAAPHISIDSLLALHVAVNHSMQLASEVNTKYYNQTPS